MKMKKLQMNNKLHKIIIILVLVIIGVLLFFILDADNKKTEKIKRGKGELSAVIKISEIKDDLVKLSIELYPIDEEPIKIDSIIVNVLDELKVDKNLNYDINKTDIKSIKVEQKISKDSPFSTGELNFRLPSVSKKFPLQNHKFNIKVFAKSEEKSLYIREFKIQNNTSWFKVNKSLWSINQMDEQGFCLQGNKKCFQDFNVLDNYIFFSLTYSMLFILLVVTPYILLFLMTIIALWRRDFSKAPEDTEVGIIMTIIIGLPALHLTIKQNYNSVISNIDIIVLITYLGIFILYCRSLKKYFLSFFIK
jgi:hypothetical protein